MSLLYKKKIEYFVKILTLRDFEWIFFKPKKNLQSNLSFVQNFLLNLNKSHKKWFQIFHYVRKINSNKWISFEFRQTFIIKFKVNQKNCHTTKLLTILQNFLIYSIMKNIKFLKNSLNIFIMLESWNFTTTLLISQNVCIKWLNKVK